MKLRLREDNRPPRKSSSAGDVVVVVVDAFSAGRSVVVKS